MKIHKFVATVRLYSDYSNNAACRVVRTASTVDRRRVDAADAGVGPVFPLQSSAIHVFAVETAPEADRFGFVRAGFACAR